MKAKLRKHTPNSHPHDKRSKFHCTFQITIFIIIIFYFSWFSSINFFDFFDRMWCILTNVAFEIDINLEVQHVRRACCFSLCSIGCFYLNSYDFIVRVSITTFFIVQIIWIFFCDFSMYIGYSKMYCVIHCLSLIHYLSLWELFICKKITL